MWERNLELEPSNTPRPTPALHHTASRAKQLTELRKGVKCLWSRKAQEARIRLGLERQAGLGRAERQRKGKVLVSKSIQKRKAEAVFDSHVGDANYTMSSPSPAPSCIPSIWQTPIQETGGQRCVRDKDRSPVPVLPLIIMWPWVSHLHLWASVWSAK